MINTISSFRKFVVFLFLLLKYLQFSENCGEVANEVRDWLDNIEAHL